LISSCPSSAGIRRVISGGIIELTSEICAMCP
jgi:hypothetical protein